MKTKSGKPVRRLVVLLMVLMLTAGMFIIPGSAGAATKKVVGSKPTITVTSPVQYPPDKISRGSKVHLGGTVRASSGSYIYLIRTRITNRVTKDSAMLKDWRPKGKRKPVSVSIANTANKLVKFGTLPKGHYTIDMYVFARNKKNGNTASKRVMHKGFSIV